jgi:phage terminase large subunit-like protein
MAMVPRGHIDEKKFELDGTPIIPLSKTDDELREIVKLLEQIEERKRYRLMDFFVPYDKQTQFFDAGLTYRERMFFAGNQLGKTEAGAFEMACHLTGLYPDWWLGRRFTRPIRAWAAGETSLATRDVLQKKLCGEPGVELAFGSGMIPKENFHDKPSLARGITDAFDTVQVKHYTNGVFDGVSILRFKSFEQGRTKFQGDSIDLIWLDEEAPLEIYTECLTRTNATKGGMFVTFTPLKGRTPLVCRFLDEKNADRWWVVMTIYEVGHYTPEERDRIVASYPAHEREARVNGTPMLGSGLIFPVTEDEIAEDQLTYIPAHWVWGWGIDFGIGHPFGASLMAWDRDNDIVHLHFCFKIADALPPIHASRMKSIAINVKVSYPHDGDSREKSSGVVLSKSYKAEGLIMQPDHAHFESGGYDTEAGVKEMHDRMKSGRLKANRAMRAFFDEMRLYHRKDGLIVKVNDDILSATRTGLIDRRRWGVAVLGSKKPAPKRPQEPQDWDPHTGT